MALGLQCFGMFALVLRCGFRVWGARTIASSAKTLNPRDYRVQEMCCLLRHLHTARVRSTSAMFVLPIDDKKAPMEP